MTSVCLPLVIRGHLLVLLLIAPGRKRGSTSLFLVGQYVLKQNLELQRGSLRKSSTQSAQQELACIRPSKVKGII